DSLMYPSRQAPPISPPATAVVQTKEAPSPQFPSTLFPPPASGFSLFKRFCSKPIEIPRDFTIGYCNLARQFAIARHPEATNINKAEIAPIQTQHHNISRCANSQVAQLFAVNDTRWRPRCTRDHFIERHAEVDKF